MEDVKPQLEFGYMYFTGRDISQRTTVVLYIKKLKQAQKHFTDQQIIDSFLFFGNYIEQDCIIPGVAEGTDVFVDFTNLGITELPIDLIR